jgi:hypothetical protein
VATLQAHWHSATAALTTNCRHGAGRRGRDRPEAATGPGAALTQALSPSESGFSDQLVTVTAPPHLRAAAAQLSCIMIRDSPTLAVTPSQSPRRCAVAAGLTVTGRAAAAGWPGLRHSGSESEAQAEGRNGRGWSRGGESSQ